MHILQIVAAPAGGIRKHIHDIIQGEYNGQTLKFSYICCEKKGDKVFKKEIGHIKETLVGYLDLHIIKKPTLQDCHNIIKIYKFAKKNRVDVIHGHGAKGGLYARLVSKLIGCRSIYTPHGGAVHKMFGPFEGWLFRLTERVLSTITDVVICESEYTRAAYANLGCVRPRIIVNYNGIDSFERPCRHLDSEQRVSRSGKVERKHSIGIFAILRPEKGHSDLIRAMSILHTQGVIASLNVYGEGDGRHYLEELVSELNLSERVRFYGEVDDPLHHMAGLDIVAVPSRFESFGYVVLEALSVGVPVIANNIGGLPEVVRNLSDGVLIDTTNIELFASTLKDMISNPRMPDGSTVEYFKKDRMISRIGSIYSGSFK